MEEQDGCRDKKQTDTESVGPSRAYTSGSTVIKSKQSDLQNGSADIILTMW